MFGAIFYAIFARGEQQPWAENEDEQEMNTKTTRCSEPRSSHDSTDM